MEKSKNWNVIMNMAVAGHLSMRWTKKMTRVNNLITNHFTGIYNKY